MTYEEAKQCKEYLDHINRQLSKQLKVFPTNEFGLVPDEIRESVEYQKIKQAYDESFKRLRDFNSYFIRNFKKEYLREKRRR